MKKLLSYIFAVSAATILFASCNQVTKSIDDTLHGRPKQNKEDAFMSSSGTDNTSNFLTDAHALEQAETALRNLPELKGKKINVYDDINLYDDGRIMIKVQDPDTLQNINEYDYSSNKEWGAKQPVNLSGTIVTNLNQEIIPLDSIRFVTVAKIGKIYADSAKRYGSTSILSHVYYVNEAKQWYCDDINGSRANYQIFFHADGTVKEFNRE